MSKADWGLVPQRYSAKAEDAEIRVRGLLSKYKHLTGFLEQAALSIDRAFYDKPPVWLDVTTDAGIIYLNMCICVDTNTQEIEDTYNAWVNDWFQWHAPEWFVGNPSVAVRLRMKQTQSSEV